MLDERTVQLGAGDRAVRIIGPAQQTLRRLREHLDSTSSVDAASDADAPADERQAAAHQSTEPQAADQTIRARARRQLAAVLIDGLPLPAALLAEQLSELHLGMLLLRDDHPVDRADVAAGYPAAAVGHTRAAAVRRTCLRQHPEAAVVCAASVAQEPVDIHVIFAMRAVAPARLAAAATQAQLVLPVVRHDTSWQIGPLLSRQRGPCPRCLLLQGTVADPHFEAVQTALADQTPSPSPPLGPGDPQSAAVLASLLAREIQLAVDGEFTPQTASRIIGLSTRTGRLSLVPVIPHPECDCRLHTAADR